ncbi:hypothetical protein ACIQU6_21600 [Streptomyces sp. NPDC090442]|uniref:hypothetical protein n=1 Tax=Streptomyces sp. NPDC090442 TaxID=3365962 RepID=UPI003822B633
MRQSLKTCVLVAATSTVLGVGAGPVFADAGAVARPPLAAPLQVAERGAPAAPHRAAAEPRRKPRPAPPARGAQQGAQARPGREPRMREVARAGKSAGEALLASSGAERLGLVAGVGGGLLLGGAVLLRRARKRRV